MLSSCGCCWTCWIQHIAAHQIICALRQALVLQTAEPTSTLAGDVGSPAPDKLPVRQGMFGGLGDPSEPPSSAPASSALTPLVNDVSQAAAPPLANVSIAAGNEVGLMDAPTQAVLEIAEAAPAAQPVAGSVEQDSIRDEQVRQVFNCLAIPPPTARIPDVRKRTLGQCEIAQDMLSSCDVY